MAHFRLSIGQDAANCGQSTDEAKSLTIAGIICRNFTSGADLVFITYLTC